MDEALFPYEEGIPIEAALRVSHHYHSDTIYQAAWCVVILFSLLTVIMLGIIWRRRVVLLKQNDDIRILENRYQSLLAEWVAGEYEDSEVRENSRDKEELLSLNFHELSQPLRRMVFKEQLIKMRKTVGGQEASRLRDLYLILGFKTDTFSKLISGNRDPLVLVESFNELTTMHIHETASLSVQYLQHSNPMVSAAAMRALVHFGTDGKFLDFLYKLDTELTDWQQAHLFTALQAKNPASLPNFKNWQDHPLESVRKFAEKMGEHFSTSDFFIDEEDEDDSEAINNELFIKQSDVYEDMDVRSRPIL